MVVDVLAIERRLREEPGCGCWSDAHRKDGGERVVIGGWLSLPFWKKSFL